jgi:non-ribosomal peptide synthetase component F
LAALFAGATYIPLNPTFPPEKTAAMIEEGDLDAIIVDGTCMPQLPVVLAGKSGTRLLAPDYDGTDVTGVNATVLDRSALAGMSPLHDLPPISAEDIAYLLFTSGSTGKPKGVPVTHANAVYFMEVMSRRYNITPDDRLSQTFDQTFDLSVFDLFMAWSNGACVYGLSPIDLLSPTKFINTHQLTVWFSVPSVPAQMIRRNTLQPKTLPTLRLSLFCGEPLADRSAELWQQATRPPCAAMASCQLAVRMMVWPQLWLTATFVPSRTASRASCWSMARRRPPDIGAILTRQRSAT